MTEHFQVPPLNGNASGWWQALTARERAAGLPSRQLLSAQPTDDRTARRVQQ